MVKWTRNEIETAFEHYLDVTRRCGASGDWSKWADLFTEDVDYFVCGDLVWNSREEVRKGVIDIYVYPFNQIKHYPLQWHIIDEDRGWVVFEIYCRMDDPGDGDVYQIKNVILIKYAGNNSWRFEEDHYIADRMTDMVDKWFLVKEKTEKLKGVNHHESSTILL